MHQLRDRHAGGTTVAAITPDTSVPSVSSASPEPTPTVVTPTAVKATPKPPAPKPPALPALPAPGSIPVTVYNVSRSTAKGALAVTRLHAAGYVVQGEHTARYTESASIVWYVPGNAVSLAEAKALVARNLGFTAVGPRPKIVPAAAGLIVAVARSY